MVLKLRIYFYVLFGSKRWSVFEVSEWELDCNIVNFLVVLLYYYTYYTIKIVKKNLTLGCNQDPVLKCWHRFSFETQKK